MLDILIDIEETTLETRNKRDGGTYSLQTGYAHLVDRQGNPLRYPERFVLFPPRNPDGSTVPYQKGQYVIAPTSYRIDNRGFLELGYLELAPATTSKKG